MATSSVFNFNLLGKILDIGLAGLSAVPTLSAEWGSGQHLQTIQNSVQVAAQLATAATSNPETQQQIAAAASAVPTVISAVVALINEIKSL